MTIAAPAEFYDARLPIMADLRRRYGFLWAAAASLIPTGSDIVELGCGAGGFAGTYARRFGGYIGLDFAPAQIEAARRWWPHLDFRLADLRTDPIPDAPVYVALEVLEHLDDDLGLLERLPVGGSVVLSVPSFDSAAHVRHFPAPESAAARYSAVLKIDRRGTVPAPRKGTYFHLLGGRR